MQMRKSWRNGSIIALFRWPMPFATAMVFGDQGIPRVTEMLVGGERFHGSLGLGEIPCFDYPLVN